MSEETGKKHGKSIGGYELLSLLGRGGMGAVYKARQTSLDRTVALKVLTPSLAKNTDFIHRFIREARSAGRLNHPNIVTGIDVGEAEGYFYFAMEFVEGESLGEKLKRDGRIPPLEAVSVIRQVAEGLKHAHDHDMIHRDVKPDNIMVDVRGTAKLCDLGLARATSGDDASLTQTGTALGTPHYISPEQARGEAEVDGRVDIYSLGATLYHLVSGETPYQGATAAVVLTKHLSDPVPNLREVAPDAGGGIAAVISKCMAKSPAGRYGDMGELSADLDLITAGKSPKALVSMPRRRRSPTGTGTRTTAPVDPITGRRQPVLARTETSHPVQPWILIAAGVGLMLVTAAGAWAFTRPGKEPAPVVVRKEPPPPEKTPELPPDRPPEKLGPDYGKMLAEAEGYFKANPGDFDGAIARFAKVRDSAGASMHKLEAMKRVDNLTALRNAEIKKAGDRIQTDADALKAKGNYDAAIAAWDKLPANLVRHLGLRANTAKADLRRKAQGHIQKALDAANRELAVGNPTAGLKELVAAREITYAKWQGKIADARTRLESALKNTAELERQKALAKERDRLNKHLVAFDAAAGKGDFLKAIAAAEKAGADRTIKTFAKQATALKELGDQLKKMREAQQIVLDVLKNGKAHTFRTTSGEKFRGKVSEATPEYLQVSVEQKEAGFTAYFPKKIMISSLAEEMRESLRGKFKPGSPSGHLASAIRAYVDRDKSGMESSLDAAKEHILAPRWTGKLELLRLGAVEANAKLAWQALKREPAARPGFKLTEKTATKLLGKIGAFERDHGTTRFARGAAAEIAAVKDRARAVMIAWIDIPATALQVLGTAGTRIASNIREGTISVSVPNGGKSMTPLVPNAQDFRMQFEYRGAGIEMFLRKPSRQWRGCVLALLSDRNAKIRYYPEEDQARAQDITLDTKGISAAAWHRVEASMKAGSLLIKVDGRVLAQKNALPAVSRGDSYALIWDTKGGAVQFRNLKVAVQDKDSATASRGGITTGLIGNLDKRGGTFLDLQADADRKHRRFEPFLVGDRLHPGTTKLLIDKLFSFNRATVVWRQHRGQRRIIAVWQQVPKPQAGVSAGKVLSTMISPDGAWAVFDLQPDSGDPIQRYAPRWKDAAAREAIKALKVGERVKVQWTWETRRRALKIEKTQ